VHDAAASDWPILRAQMLSALSSLLPGSNERKEQAFRDAASAGNVAVVTEMMSPDLVNTVDLRNDKSPIPQSPNDPVTQSFFP